MHMHRLARAAPRAPAACSHSELPQRRAVTVAPSRKPPFGRCAHDRVHIGFGQCPSRRRRRHWRQQHLRHARRRHPQVAADVGALSRRESVMVARWVVDRVREQPPTGRHLDHECRWKQSAAVTHRRRIRVADRAPVVSRRPLHCLQRLRKRHQQRPRHRDRQCRRLTCASIDDERDWRAVAFVVTRRRQYRLHGDLRSDRLLDFRRKLEWQRATTAHVRR